MSGLSTHVLDTSLGRPASGVAVRLEVREGEGWRVVGEGATDADGRLRTLLGSEPLRKSVYRLTFDTGSYFAAGSRETFFPEASIVFEIHDPAQHHHVPLLLSPFGYSTYRGS